MGQTCGGQRGRTWAAAAVQHYEPPTAHQVMTGAGLQGCSIPGGALDSGRHLQPQSAPERHQVKSLRGIGSRSR